MPCAHPIPAWRSSKLVYDREKGAVVRVDSAKLTLKREDVRELVADVDRPLVQFEYLLPCGTCVGCQISRARSWAVRCELELREHARACFVTLTYRDADLPLFRTLEKDHLGRFIRSVRKKQLRAKRPFRVFACGEYGEWRGRPHYHAIVFGTEDEQMIRESWPKGFATVSPVTPGRVAYTAGYCAKKVGLLDPPRLEVDADGVVVDEYQPPFLTMSRRPGIGGWARRFPRSWRTQARWQGRDVPVPRFLHQSWQDSASELEKAQLLLERVESQMRPTVRELDASAAIAASRLALTSSRRTL